MEWRTQEREMTIAWQQNDATKLTAMIKATGIIGVPSLSNAPDMDLFKDFLLVSIQILMWSMEFVCYLVIITK